MTDERVANGEWNGHDPDVVESLAHERSGLAWQRTGLSWLGAGAAVIRYFVAGGMWSAQAVMGWLMIITGAIIVGAGSALFRRRSSTLHADEPLAPPVLGIALSSIAAGGCALVIAGIEVKTIIGG